MNLTIIGRETAIFKVAKRPKSQEVGRVLNKQDEGLKKV